MRREGTKPHRALPPVGGARWTGLPEGGVARVAGIGWRMKGKLLALTGDDCHPGGDKGAHGQTEVRRFPNASR